MTRACDEVSELVQYLHLQQTTDTTTSLSKLPGFMSGLVSNIILGRCRALDKKEYFMILFSLHGQSPGRAIVLPPALAFALALALAAALALANVKVLR